MTPGKRIAVNVVATYGRSLVALACGLFSTRWVLKALGTDDFGLYAIVGSLLAFATFVGDLLKISVSRHFAYALGQGGEGDVSGWMRAALVVHVVLAALIALAGWPAGEWIICRFVSLSADRLPACLTVFRLSLACFFVVTVGIPFESLFVAHQRFVELSVFGMLQTVYVFCGAYWLLGYGGDRLIAYALFMCLGTLAVQMAQAVWAACKWRLALGVRHVDAVKVRAILGFAGWHLVGGGGWLVASRGTDFVTNRFFGPAGNAAYGIAFQVQRHAEALANALVGAFSPAVTERRGAGDADGARAMALQSAFWGAFLMALFVVPLLAEIDTVLGLWLVKPPAGAGELCSVWLVIAVLGKLTMGQYLAISADGRIAAWQVVVGVVQALAWPLALALAVGGVGLRAAAVANAIVFPICHAATVYYGRKTAGVSIRSWLRRVVLPFACVSLVAGTVALLPRLWMPVGFWRVAVVSALTSVVFLSAIWLRKRGELGK